MCSLFLELHLGCVVVRIEVQFAETFLCVGDFVEEFTS